MSNIPDRTNLNFYLKIHEETSSKIDNLQTALFSTISIIIASALIGILLGLKDFSKSWSQIFAYPTSLIIVGILWAVVLFLNGIIIFIFVKCVKYGFRIIQIEKNILERPIQYGEIEHFIPNDKSSFLPLLSTYIYFPGLTASNFSHNYFPLLFIFTILSGIIVAVAQYVLLSSAISRNFSSVYYPICLLLDSDNVLISVLICLMFLLVCLLVIPSLVPGNHEIGRNYKDKEILIISETLSHLHGTEVAIVGFARNMLQLNKNVLIVGPIENGGRLVREKCEQNGIPIAQLPSIGTWFLGQPDYRLAIPFPISLFISDKTKIIFINAFPGTLGIFGLLLGKIKRKKIIFYYHVYLPKFVECLPLVGRTKLVKNFFKNITRRFSNMCDLVIVPSKFVTRKMIEWGVNKSKIKIVPLGIDRFFVDIPSQEEIMRIKNIYSFPLILYVGRLSQEKNLKLLIYTMDKILEKYPSAKLIIAGRGPEKKRLERLIKKLGLGEHIIFKGYLDWENLKPLYWAADVFCMPSLGETQGLSILEAKACQRACVVLNEAGAGEQIENEIDGILVDEKENIKSTSLAFASAIHKILSEKNFAIRLSKEARIRTLRRTMDISTKELVQIFDSI